MKKKLLAAVSAVVAAAAMWISPAAQANGGGVELDHFPKAKATDLAALQNGAKLFVNYCLNCHGLSAVRYNRLTELGLTKEQIQDNLMFTTDKIGDQMTIAMNAKDAKSFFGVTPPDLTLEARARSTEEAPGVDWIYTYLRSFYRDADRPTGWNNTVFPNVGMPHILYGLQGPRELKVEEVKPEGAGADAKWVKVTTTYDATGFKTEKTEPADAHHESVHREFTAGDAAKAAAYDEQVGDIVAFLAWTAEPIKQTRIKLGAVVLAFLAVFTFLAWRLNAAYWKDIR
ncbi:cytochrome c1 [Derxia gummosa]|uniref:Cytochrome c1 n=1 Tax=Derxia gummosa DSM 723 TaxID=1121388 RepID=A0A8B6X5U2_9BURK|nr:cytochrome c1 [Derxia gummosa]